MHADLVVDARELRLDALLLELVERSLALAERLLELAACALHVGVLRPVGRLGRVEPAQRGIEAGLGEPRTAQALGDRGEHLATAPLGVGDRAEPHLELALRTADRARVVLEQLGELRRVLHLEPEERLLLRRERLAHLRDLAIERLAQAARLSLEHLARELAVVLREELRRAGDLLRVATGDLHDEEQRGCTGRDLSSSRTSTLRRILRSASSMSSRRSG